MGVMKGLNKKATVQKTATPANRSMNSATICMVTTTPTPANRKMNAPARVKPSKY